MTMLEDLRRISAVTESEKNACLAKARIESFIFLRKYAAQIEQDARDAERIEWMDDHVTAIVCGEDFISIGNVIGYFREIIDDAMTKEYGNV